MIRISYLYRVRNLVNRRVYYGIHTTADISFANPPVRLCDLSRGVPQRSADGLSVRYDTLPEFTNKLMLSDLAAMGSHNFLIESLYASPLREDVQRIYNQHVTEEFLKSPFSYNGVVQIVGKPHRVTSEDNPMYDEETRAKMSKILKSKVIIRGPKGRILKIINKDEAQALKIA